LLGFKAPEVSKELLEKVRGSFNLKAITKEDFFIKPESNKCRVIGINPGTLLTDEVVLDIDFSANNGIDTERDILKLAVIERFKNTGHIGLGFARGIGMKKGAIASSVAHDSHNLIVVGTNETDMAIAANRIKELGGGCLVVCDGKILSELPLPFGGLMTDIPANEVAERNKKLGELAAELGVNDGINPFMNMSFIALPVIPHLKMTTHGLIDVDNQKLISLFV
jgi:adenine deaminase